MDFSASSEGLIQGAVGLGVGILAWERQAVKKYAQSNPNYNYLSADGFSDALAGILGKGLVKTINPSWTGQPAPVRPNLLGWLNSYTVGGLAVIVFDSLASEVKWYKGLPAVSSIVKGAGYGLAAGGALGGVFDPAPATHRPGFGDTGGRTPPGIQSPMGYAVYSAEAHNAAIQGR